MRMHTFDQPIQSGDLPVFIECDHIPPLPALAVFTKEPLLHNHIGVQPQITSPLEQPVLSPVGVKLVVVAFALSFVSAEMSETWEIGTDLFDAGGFASVGSVGFDGRGAELFEEFNALGFRGRVPDVYSYCLCDCVRLIYGNGHFWFDRCGGIGWRVGYAMETKKLEGSIGFWYYLSMTWS